MNAKQIEATADRARAAVEKLIEPESVPSKEDALAILERTLDMLNDTAMALKEEIGQ